VRIKNNKAQRNKRKLQGPTQQKKNTKAQRYKSKIQMNLNEFKIEFKNNKIT